MTERKPQLRAMLAECLQLIITDMLEMQKQILLSEDLARVFGKQAVCPSSMRFFPRHVNALDQQHEILVNSRVQFEEKLKRFRGYAEDITEVLKADDEDLNGVWKETLWNVFARRVRTLETENPNAS